MTRRRRFLLDTHVLLWLLGGDRRLPAAARARLDEADAVYVSAASIWEISIKRALGRLRAPTDLLAVIAESSLEPLAVRLDHADLAGGLPRHHPDPFDRMLVAQALVDHLTLVSADPVLPAYDVELMSV